MVKSPLINKSPGLSLKNQNAWKWGVFLLVLLGIVFYHFSSQIQLRKEQEHLRSRLEAAQKEIFDLRHNQPPAASDVLSHPLYHKKLSDNFQKIFMFFKIERLVLSGKNFSRPFQILDSLIGPPLQEPTFNVLRNNTKGIISPSEIDASFHAYIPEPVMKTGTLGEKIARFFNSFLKIKTSEEREKIEALRALIQKDHTKKALDFIDINFPEYKEWAKVLKDRCEAKKALKALEVLVFESLRV